MTIVSWVVVDALRIDAGAGDRRLATRESLNRQVYAQVMWLARNSAMNNRVDLCNRLRSRCDVAVHAKRATHAAHAAPNVRCAKERVFVEFGP